MDTHVSSIVHAAAACSVYLEDNSVYPLWGRLVGSSLEYFHIFQLNISITKHGDTHIYCRHPLWVWRNTGYMGWSSCTHERRVKSKYIRGLRILNEWKEVFYTPVRSHLVFSLSLGLGGLTDARTLHQLKKRRRLGATHKQIVIDNQFSWV